MSKNDLWKWCSGDLDGVLSFLKKVEIFKTVLIVWEQSVYRQT